MALYLVVQKESQSENQKVELTDEPMVFVMVVQLELAMVLQLVVQKVK